MVLVLDASGSMNEPDGHGSTKIKAAKAAMKTIIGQLPGDVQVGLRVYGHRVPSAPDHAKACQDTQLVAPVTMLDKAGLTAAVDRFKALGETPIGLSLQRAGADLPKGTSGSIVLVSDGEDSCAPPAPCDVARKLKASGLQVTVDTVGLKVDAKARSELTCIAQATGGSYTDVADTAELATKLGTVTQQAARPRRGVQGGTKVQGGTSLGDAPALVAGRYTDSIVVDETLYYAVDLPPHSKVTGRVTFDAAKVPESTMMYDYAVAGVDWVDERGSSLFLFSSGSGLVNQGKTAVIGSTAAGTNETPMRAYVRVKLARQFFPVGTEVPIMIEILGAGGQEAGQGSGVPSPSASESASPSASSRAASAPAAASGHSTLVLVGVGVGAALAGLLVGYVGGYVGGRRSGRRRASIAGVLPYPPPGY